MLTVAGLAVAMLASLLSIVSAPVSAAVVIERLPEGFTAELINNLGHVAGRQMNRLAVWDGIEVEERHPSSIDPRGFDDAGTILGFDSGEPTLWYSDGTTDTLQRPLNSNGNPEYIYSVHGPGPGNLVVGTRMWREPPPSNAVAWFGPTATPSVVTGLATVFAMAPDGTMVGVLPNAGETMGFLKDGTVTPAPNLPSTYSVFDVSSSGHVVGYGPGGYYLYHDGTVTPLVTSTSTFYARAVNDKGFVAGQWSNPAQPTDPPLAAVRTPDGELISIPDLVGSSGGHWLELYDAIDINDECQVIGRGLYEDDAGNLIFGHFRTQLPDCAVDEFDVQLTVPSDAVAIGEPVTITLTVRTSGDQPIDGFALLDGVGLRFDPEQIELLSGPTPDAPGGMGANSTLTFSYQVAAKASGRLEIRAGASGTRNGEPVDAEVGGNLMVPAQLKVDMSTSVDSATKVGDVIDVVATVTNEEAAAISGIRTETLAVDPSAMASHVSGPTSADGSDPRVSPVTLEAGASTTFTWSYLAEEKGTVTFESSFTARDPYSNDLFGVSGSVSVAIEEPGLEISELRLQPGSPVPGDFGNLRGTVTNIGSVDVTGIDFSIESNPEIVVIDRLLNELDPSVSPRIASLATGESQEFMIPFGMVSDAGGLATWTVDLTMTGAAEVDGESTEVSTVGHVGGGLDLSVYWSSILSEVRRLLLQDALDFFEGINDWGDRSTLGGVAVGTGEGILTALQKMGDGALTAGELVVTKDGREQLSETAKGIVAASREYLHTTSMKKMFVDFADVRDDIAVGGVEVFANWLRDIDEAYTQGDVRAVSNLIAEPATAIATGVGVEQAGAQLFGRLLTQPMVRRAMSGFKKAPEGVDEATGPVDFDKVVDGDYADLKDMPTGVPVTGQTVARAGLTADEHAWMIETAKEHGVAFFVRPRPEQAARFAKLGYNAKPMAIKLKSVNEIDAQWLGFDDYAESQGLVVLREPTDPFPAMVEAVERGDLEWGGKEIDDIIERYNLRKAEWESKDALLEKLNAGDGFKIQRYGKTITTKVAVNDDGLLIFTHNNKPVYSDIDLLSIARPDGSPIPPELHKLISEQAGFGIDGQHGDSVMTSDFPNWTVAKKFAVQYAEEHMRGGDPLVIVQPDVTTLGYVDTIDVPAGDLPGSGYDLFGTITTTYEGAGRQ